ncbi:transglutaminase-like domain-containing protein [Candidatus Woesearchaeota archaeon]|nr:transglutaminase-like domain-containing protein [Candidatus Woesearchaeota archaeon]
MEEEELIKEAERALQELQKKKAHRHHTDEMHEPIDGKRNPFAYLLVLVLLLLVILMAIPYYGIKLDPFPKNIPEPDDVMPYHVEVLINDTPTVQSTDRVDMLQLVIPDHQAIRNMAVKIATESCEGSSDICYAKALFYFVRDNFKYVSDPPNEYYESPFETLYSGGADCDGLAILLANLESAIGIPVRFAFIPDHVYVQIKLDDAPKKYKENDDWISLDATCDGCEFGEVPYSTLNKKKEYLYI